MTDFLLLEQLHKMIKDIIKPRLMFRKGISAKGFFRPYLPMSEYTKATIFRSIDEITPVMVRFSSMMGDMGAADTARNIKGMDIKFKAEEKDYDMMCRSLPVMFINDENKISELFCALSCQHISDSQYGREFWEFVTRNPETINCVMRLFSWQGLSDSFVDMKWYSVNNVVWQNSKGESFFVRYKWVPVKDFDTEYERKKKLDRNSAEFMAGYDPDRAINGLKKCISQGKFPNYELQIQMKYAENGAEENVAEQFCKRTLIWDEKNSPYIAIGIMKLTQIPEDMRRDCELLSFTPSNTIDGIQTYHDKFSDILDYIYKIEASERGGVL